MVFLRKIVGTTRLGRWNVAKTMKEASITAELANHDHCGSDLCALPPSMDKNDKKTNDNSNAYEPQHPETQASSSVLNEHKNSFSYLRPFLI